MGRRRSINGLRSASSDETTGKDIRNGYERIERLAEGQIANPRGLPLVKNFAVDPADNVTGYKSFKAGSFNFRRDEYFAYVDTPNGFHTMPVDAFLRALMRDVAWGFFYGTVNFDQVFGTTNYYGEVDMFVGATNEAYTSAGREFIERFKSNDLMDIFKQMVSDWTNEGYDPFAAPMETGVPWGVKNGDNDEAVGRQRVTARRMVGLKGDTPIRTDANGYPVNRMFEDVKQDAPEVFAGARLRARGLGVQPVRLSVALRRDLEPVGLLGGQGQPVLPDLGGVHPAGRARQRPLRVVHHAVGRDRLEHQGRRDRASEGRSSSSGPATSPACRPTSATRASRPSAPCCWSGRTARRRSRT